MKNIKLLYRSYLNMPIPIKASIWFVFCNFLLKGISFITSPLFAHILTVEEYGKMNLFNTYQQIILIFTTLELSLGAYQRGLIKYRDKKLLTESTLFLSVLITLGVYILLFPIRKQFYSLMKINFFSYNLLYVYLMLQPAYSCWLIKHRMEYKYQAAVITTIISSVLPILLSIVFVYINPTALSKNVGYLLGLIVCYLPFFIKYFKPVHIIENIKIAILQWKFEIKFQLPLVFHSLSYLVLGQADRIMIGKILGDKAVGLYSVSSLISMSVSIFQTSINQAFIPFFYKKMEGKEYKTISDIVNILLVFIAYIIFICILIAPEIVELLYPYEYWEAKWVIPPIMLGIYYMFLYSLFTNVETYFEKTKYIMYVSVVCAVINIGLNFIVINKIGYIGCGYTTLISYILFAIGHGFFYKKICNNSIEEKNIYDLKYIFSVSFAITVLTSIVTVFYSNTVVRWGFILMLLIIGLFNFKKVKFIKSVVKK